MEEFYNPWDIYKRPNNSEETYYNDYIKTKYSIDKETAGKRLKTGICILAALLSVGLIIRAYFIHSDYLSGVNTVKAEKIIILLHKKFDNYEGKFSLNYSRYWLDDKNKENVDCKDYSFAFAILYGPPAKVAYNNKHAFVVIGNKIIEPQQRIEKHGIIDLNYRFTGADYSINKTIGRFFSQDVIKVRRFFYE